MTLWEEDRDLFWTVDGVGWFFKGLWWSTEGPYDDIETAWKAREIYFEALAE